MPTLLTQAVLFDLDGTLVDSTASVDRSWHHVARLMGRDPAEIVGKYHGMPGNLILQLVDPTLSEDRIRELNQSLLDLETTDTLDVTALPGATTAMNTLPAERWAIVTSCSTLLAAARLNAAGLPTPKTIITADDITRGKPHPEPFLTGARALGYPPQDTASSSRTPPLGSLPPKQQVARSSEFRPPTASSTPRSSRISRR